MSLSSCPSAGFRFSGDGPGPLREGQVRSLGEARAGDGEGVDARSDPTAPVSVQIGLTRHAVTGAYWRDHAGRL